MRMRVTAFRIAVLVALAISFFPSLYALPLNILVYPSTGVQGTPVAGFIGSFAASESNPSISSFIATIDWGDSTSTAGTIAESGIAGLYTVSGTHTYVASGMYDLFIFASDSADSTNNNSGRVITIQNAPLIVTGNYFDSTIYVGFYEVVATFVDENPYASIADFGAAIEWEEGALPESASAIARIGSSNTYQVYGTHTYDVPGLKVVTVTVTDFNNHNFTSGMSFTGDRIFAGNFD
jgi:hypothetical protein